MCGRIDLHNSIDEIAERFAAEFSEGTLFGPTYNFAPTETLPAILNFEDKRVVTVQQWGLKPFTRGQPPLFNARADKLLELGRYRSAIEKRRCIVPISGFYEWKRVGKERIPHYIRATDRDIIGLAGFWEGPKDRIEGRSFTVITTNANEALSPLHHRMPVMLTDEGEAVWLNQDLTDADAMAALAVPYPDDLLSIVQVSSTVNKASNKGSNCLDLAQPDQLSMFA